MISFVLLAKATFMYKPAQEKLIGLPRDLNMSSDPALKSMDSLRVTKASSLLQAQLTDSLYSRYPGVIRSPRQCVLQYFLP